jgi:hypothetical protein
LWGFIFPRTALACVSHSSGHSAGIWLPGWGCGRLGRFRGAGSLCDHPSDYLT